MSDTAVDTRELCAFNLALGEYLRWNQREQRALFISAYRTLLDTLLAAR